MERHLAQPIVISLAVKIKYVNSQVNFLGLSACDAIFQCNQSVIKQSHWNPG